MTLTPLNARATLWAGCTKVNRQNAGFCFFSAIAKPFVAYLGYKIEINEKISVFKRIFIDCSGGIIAIGRRASSGRPADQQFYMCHYYC
jgi:hypothetical protein